MRDSWKKRGIGLLLSSSLPLLSLFGTMGSAIAQSVVTLPNGVRCEGQFNGYTGQGICEYPEGYYRGSLLNGKRQGRGVFYFSGGVNQEDDSFATIYDGEFSNDLPNGRGKFIYGNDDRYDGAVKDGIPNGTGQFIFRELDTENFYLVVDHRLITFEEDDARDSRYYGGVRNGKPNGRGSLVYGICQTYGSDLRCLRYDGNFQDGFPHGQGTLMTPACNTRAGQLLCTRFTGRFYRGQPNGSGSVIFANGDRCQGEFNDLTFSGKGNCSYANGDRYSGELRYGVPHGIGTANYSNGRSYSGEFLYGAPKPR